MSQVALELVSIAAAFVVVWSAGVVAVVPSGRRVTRAVLWTLFSVAGAVVLATGMELFWVRAAADPFDWLVRAALLVWPVVLASGVRSAVSAWWAVVVFRRGERLRAWARWYASGRGGEL